MIDVAAPRGSFTLRGHPAGRADQRRRRRDPGPGDADALLAKLPGAHRVIVYSRPDGEPEACDVPVGFGCRNGTCHNCESGLLAGTVSYGPDPLEPPPEGQILVCCSRPTSELTLDL